MNIKENNLQENVTTDPNILENQFVRWVTNKITGASQLKKVSGLILKISNILGLQSALDSKINSLPSGFQQLAKVVDGGIAASSIKDGSFASLIEMDTLTDTGLYSPSVSITDSLMGTIFYVLTGNSAQFILSSKGIWYRQYSESWSLPMYVGGGNDNIILTYDEAFNLADEDKLTPGVAYTISDYDSTGYSLIVLTAATSSDFFQNGYASAPVPIHRFGTHVIGSESVTFLDVWNSTLMPSVGNVCVWYNKLYANITGGIGYADGYSLDTTNWNLINPITYMEFYRFDLHTIVYDFKNNAVLSESDSFGNTFGESVVAYDGFKTIHNDWGLNVDGGEFYGNVLSRCYNISGHIAHLSRNTGIGSIFDVRVDTNGQDVVGCSITDNSINGQLNDCTLYLDGSAVIYSNKIDGVVTNIHNHSSLMRCYIAEGAFLRNFTIELEEAYLSGCDIHNTYDGGGGSFYYEFIDEELRFVLSERRIFAAYHVGAGVFTLGAGNDVSPIVTSGCNIYYPLRNAIKYSGSSLEYSSVEIMFSGLYEVKYDASALCDTKRDITTYLKVNGTKNQSVWSKKQYTAADMWINSSMSNIVRLNEGDILTFGYDVSGTGTAIITLGQINVVIKYLG